jgi:hypothetical protein
MTTRNVANLEALAALFDTLAGCDDPNAGEGADRYNQGTFGATSECGTWCCIAGWEMVRLYGTDRAFNYSDFILVYYKDGRGPANSVDYDTSEVEDIEWHATRSLGITREESDILFGANWRLEDGSYNDPAAAAEALRRLAKGHTIEEVTDPSYYCFHEAPDEQSTI